VQGVTAEGMQTMSTCTYKHVTPCVGGDIENAKLIYSFMHGELYIQYGRHYMSVLIFVLHAID